MPVDPLTLFVALLGINYVTVLTHELGHAAAARLAGYRVTACGLGAGRPLLRLQPGLTVYYFCLGRPFQGLTFSQPTRSDHPPAAEAALLSGGLAAHLLWVALLLPWATHAHWLLQTALWLNVAYLAVGLVPLRFRLGTALIESDARRILRVLRGTGSSLSTAGRFGLYRQCLDHLQQVRDATGALAYRTELALLELECRNTAGAADLLEGQATPPGCPSYLAGRFHTACWLLDEEREDPAADAQREAATRAFAGDAGGLALLELLELELKLRRGEDLPALIERTDALLGRPGLPIWAATAGRCLITRAAARLGRFDAAREALAGLSRPPAWLAAWLEGRERLAAGADGALQAHQQAVRSLERELAGLDAGRRAGLLASHEELGDALRELARRAGDAAAEAELDCLLAPRDGLPERIESHYGVLGAWFLAAGLVIDAVAWWALRWAPLSLLRLLIVAGPACCFAGVASALAALPTRDRKRAACVVLLLGLPALFFSLLLIGRLRLLLHRG